MSKIFFFILSIIRILKYLLSKKKRYSNLLISILICKPKSILEVGVYNGKRALEMIHAAKVFNDKIQYYGFDLFEDFQKKILKKELSKTPHTIQSIKKKIYKYGSIKLYKGFTKKTLPKFLKSKRLIDFIFIDGGHSIKTIENDWKYCSKLMNKKSIVIFDDYYIKKSKFLIKFGSNKIYKKINSRKYLKTFLPFIDKIENMNYKQNIKMFSVKLR